MFGIFRPPLSIAKVLIFSEISKYSAKYFKQTLPTTIFLYVNIA